MMFSATMPPKIRVLAEKLLKRPAKRFHFHLQTI
jgi:superfamily II DNA/RNA helicase